MTTLDQSLHASHETGDHRALVGLYTQAADQAEPLNAACFFLTNAYVYALETNHPQRHALHARLVAEGREA
ncbi:MAG: hypothetical protein Q9M48_03320 [Rhodobacterales bacterium]|nr:hypothetical protein [Rhodobacterales bacterium]